jgi:hypothetical protein
VQYPNCSIRNSGPSRLCLELGPNVEGYELCIVTLGVKQRFGDIDAQWPKRRIPIDAEPDRDARPRCIAKELIACVQRVLSEDPVQLPPKVDLASRAGINTKPPLQVAAEPS